MIILAIDPGSEQSAYVVYDVTRVLRHGICPNETLLRMLAWAAGGVEVFLADVLVIEQVQSYGMPVGREVFDTVFWAGRFYQQAYTTGLQNIHQIPRRDVKLHLCGSVRAKDANIRAALIDRFGGSAAIGKKQSQGPLYGIKSHEFAALALAVTWSDQHASETKESRYGEGVGALRVEGRTEDKSSGVRPDPQVGASAGQQRVRV